MTKNEMLNFKLAEACFVMCLPCTEYEARQQGFTYYLYNDFDSFNGGYILSKRYIENGAVTTFSDNPSRKKYSEYLTYLQGIIDGARFSERIQ